MNKFITMLKTELKLSFRGMDMVIFALCMPVVVIVILGVIYGTKTAAPGVEYTFLEQSFGALSTIAICAGGVMGIPMLIFSGTTLPCEVMPSALRKIADILPLTQGIKLLKAASLGLPLESVWFAIVIMAVVAVVCGGFTIRFFKWEQIRNFQLTLFRLRFIVSPAIVRESLDSRIM